MNPESLIHLTDLERRIEETDDEGPLYLEDGILIKAPHQLFDTLQRQTESILTKPEPDETAQ